jgi:hypothetical protein
MSGVAARRPASRTGGTMTSTSLRVTTIAAALMAAACGDATDPPRDGETAPGSTRTARTAALESGADLLQAKAPIDAIAMYLNGFHVSKDDPAMQMEAHHYCNQVNEDLAQCVLFDGNTANARMIGVEYIISEPLYGTLPADEKAYWHPHNYELLSGQLRMPGLPDVAEEEALKTKVNSYGKTWHTWMSGRSQPGSSAPPLGPARLQWSFNRDAEAIAEMVAERDKRFGFDTAAKREARQEWIGLARPQGGVDAMSFPGGVPVKGVTDNGDAATRAVPALSMKGRPDP